MGKLLPSPFFGGSFGVRGFLANRVPRIRQTRCHLSRSLVAESGEARGTYRVVTDHYSRYGSWPPRVHIRSAVVFSCIHTELAPPLERTHTQTPARTPLSRPGGCGWEVSFFAVAVLDRVRRRVVTANSSLWGARAGGGELSPLRRCEPTHHVVMSFVC